MSGIWLFLHILGLNGTYKTFALLLVLTCLILGLNHFENVVSFDNLLANFLQTSSLLHSNVLSLCLFHYVTVWLTVKDCFYI